MKKKIRSADLGWTKPERRPDVIVSLYLVPHGFQMETRHFGRATKDGNGVEVRVSCHDFAGSYDVALIGDMFSALLHATPFRHKWEDQVEKAQRQHD